MRVMVLGAGVIGTSSAYYIAKSGHEVVVVDRRSGPALETSFANAGGICPGFAGPWAAPGMPANIVRWLFTRHAPLVLRPRFDPHQWRWLARFLRNCSAERFARNKARMQRIAHYSKACLKELCEETASPSITAPAACCNSSAPRGACRRGKIHARAGRVRRHAPHARCQRRVGRGTDAARGRRRLRRRPPSAR
jgi:hypothetical protein